MRNLPVAGSGRSAGTGWMSLVGERVLSCLKIPSSLSGLKGSFSLPLVFNSRLAPDPSLVVYAIFPNGGVIADKIQFSVEMCFDNQVKWQLRRVKERSGQREGACVSWGWREIRQGHWGRQGIMLKLDVMFCIFSMVCWTVSPSSFKRSCWEVTCSIDLSH